MSSPADRPFDSQLIVSPAVDELDGSLALNDSSALDKETPQNALAKGEWKSGSLRFYSEWITDWEHLESINAPWLDLAGDAIHINPACEPNFLIPAIRHLADPTVKVLAIWIDDGRQRILGGLFPLRTIRLFKLRFSAIQLWKHDQCFDSTPLIRSGFVGSVINSFLSQLAEDKYSYLEMDTISANPVFDEALSAIEQQLKLVRFQRALFSRAAIIPGESPDAYLQQSQSKKQRKKHRRLTRRLEEQGVVSLETTEDCENPTRFAEEFLALEHSGWKGRSGTSLASDPSTESFYREMVNRSSSCGKSRFLTLRLDGHPIAMLSDLQSGGAVASYKTAYDESLAELSPGVLLEVMNIEQLHQEGIRFVDSCTVPDNQTINRLWGERTPFQTIILSLRPGLSRWILKSFPLLQKWKQQVRSIRLKPSH